MKRLIKTILVLSLATALAACNTIDGVGKDVSSGGKALSKASGKQ